MSTFSNYLEVLQREIEQNTYGQEPKELYEPISYFMALNGKRLRPLLTLLAASLYTDEWRQLSQPAQSVELFHNFTLMHDDIMDKAPLRRGAETVHTKWGDNTAILSGDVMLVQAYEKLALIQPDKLLYALQRFNKTAAEVCEGQQYDMNFEKRDDVSIPEYIEMIRLKTSVLLGFALELGAWGAGATVAHCQTLYTIGETIGIGFQLKDDLLDVYGDPDKFGKQVGGDILSNKKTFLLLKAFEVASEEQATELQSWIDRTEFNSIEKVSAVTSLYNSLGIKKYTEELILTYFNTGLSLLAELDIPAERKQPLFDFIHYLINRDK